VDGPLDVVLITLGAVVNVAAIIFIWWFGRITKLWWLLGQMRDAWKAGAARHHPAPGKCGSVNCSYPATDGTRYCTHHHQVQWAMHEETRGR
jgi:hypothetical protein